LQDCSCVAYFYYSKASSCFLIDGELRTIQKISDSTKLAFIKVQAWDQWSRAQNHPENFWFSVRLHQSPSMIIRLNKAINI
jgi:hypothetical protein